MTASADVITFDEVVEHLDPPDLACVGAVLLGRCAPRALIVTTPNKEYNLNAMVKCSRTQPCDRSVLSRLSPEELKKADMCKGCGLYLYGSPPHHDAYPLRNTDHRFEWTRAEFREWATSLAAEHGYSVRFDGAGGGAWDEKQAGMFHGPGPMSQIAIFERTEGASAAAAAGASVAAEAPDEPLNAPWMAPAAIAPAALVWASTVS